MQDDTAEEVGVDPNETYVEVMKTVDGVLSSPAEHPEWVVELCEAVSALDEWMRKGGFPPSEWRNSD